MAWKKLDDELTDPNTEEPLSAFLVRGLTRNVNDYSTALTRGGAFAFANDTILMQWASYDQPTGFVFTVDVGIAATQVQFDIVGNTKTATAVMTAMTMLMAMASERALRSTSVKAR